MVAAMRDNGGVVQINFGSAFLNQAAHEQGTTYWKALRTHMTEQGLERGSAEMEAWEAEYWAGRTKLFADVSDVADHIDRVVELDPQALLLQLGCGVRGGAGLGPCGGHPLRTASHRAPGGSWPAPRPV